MVEVVVAAVIFALTAAGFYATISALTAPAEAKTQEVTAAFLAKQKLEELRTAVNADDWDTGTEATGYGLENNHTYNNEPPVIVDGITYQIQYTVIPVGETNSFNQTGRQVSMTISW